MIRKNRMNAAFEFDKVEADGDGELKRDEIGEEH
jgi:hypothetical protein